MSTDSTRRRASLEIDPNGATFSLKKHKKSTKKKKKSFPINPVRVDDSITSTCELKSKSARKSRKSSKSNKTKKKSITKASSLIRHSPRFSTRPTISKAVSPVAPIKNNPQSNKSNKSKKKAGRRSHSVSRNRARSDNDEDSNINININENALLKRLKSENKELRKSRNCLRKQHIDKDEENAEDNFESMFDISNKEFNGLFNLVSMYQKKDKKRQTDIDKLKQENNELQQYKQKYLDAQQQIKLINQQQQQFENAEFEIKYTKQNIQSMFTFVRTTNKYINKHKQESGELREELSSLKAENTKLIKCKQEFEILKKDHMLVTQILSKVEAEIDGVQDELQIIYKCKKRLEAENETLSTHLHDLELKMSELEVENNELNSKVNVEKREYGTQTHFGYILENEHVRALESENEYLMTCNIFKMNNDNDNDNDDDDDDDDEKNDNNNGSKYFVSKCGLNTKDLLKTCANLMIVQRTGINYVEVFNLNTNKVVKSYQIDDGKNDNNKFKIYDCGISYDQKYAILCVGIFNKENLSNLNLNRSALKGFKIPKSSKK